MELVWELGYSEERSLAVGLRGNPELKELPNRWSSYSLTGEPWTRGKLLWNLFGSCGDRGKLRNV